MRTFFIGVGVVLGIGIGSACYAQSSPATVILVRHAEKEATPANDPPLTPAGVARAVAIAASLKDAGVSTVYTNQFVRTHQTGQIIGDSLHASVEIVPLTNLAVWISNLAAKAKASGGKTIVIVGHSNTFGAISRGMGGPVIPDAPDSEFDNLYILTVQDGQPTRLIRARQ